jgi:uncharacterized membrane protein YdjX (TVP38/TMEM64 family)
VDFIRQIKNPKRIRYSLVASWLFLLGACGYGYFFHASFIEGQLRRAISISVGLGYVLYLLLGCFRCFTLIPAANLLFLGILFIPPTPLFLLTIVGIGVSAATIYWFSEFLGFDVYFERRHAVRFSRIKTLLQKYELGIIIGWSFCPFAPTDAVCYLCGVLRVPFLKFLFGVLIGEGTICAIYIFLSDQALRWLYLRA